MNADDDGITASDANKKKPAMKPAVAADNNDTPQEKVGFMQKIGLCCFKFKSQTQISALEFKIANRQKKFGVDYLTLVERKATQAALKECLKEALRDIAELQTQINDHYDNIDNKATEVQSKKGDGAATTSRASKATDAPTDKPKPTKRRGEEGGNPARKSGGAEGGGPKKGPPKNKEGGKKKKKAEGQDERFSIDEE